MSALEEPDWDALEEQLDELEKETEAEVREFDAQLDANAVVPDSVTPIEAWRTWRIDDGEGCLRSIYSETEWKPGEAVRAACDMPAQFEWNLEPHGMTLRQAQEQTMQLSERRAMSVSFSVRIGSRSPRVYEPPVPPYPHVEPPEGWGYVLHDLPHPGAPEENCSCGIYAAESFAGCPLGHVAGKVKLWGKVIPGEKGYRAEYAYPSEFHIDNHDHDQLLEQFGIPIVYGGDNVPLGDPDDPNIQIVPLWGTTADPLKKQRIALCAMAGVNLTFAVYNMVVALH